MQQDASSTGSARDRLLDACLESREDGGEAATEAFLAEHPADAEWLRAQLDALRRAGLLDRAPRIDEGHSELGDFRLLRKLGEGGMGVVYLAEQRSLGRRVALKLLRPGQLHFGGARERFRREVEAVARLQHAGIVPVHVVGEHDGMPFFAMDLVEGCSLAEVLRALRGADPSRLTGRSLAQAIAQRLPEGADPGAHAASGWMFEGSWTEACLRLVQQAADALDHAHRRGVVHRDVKPSNLMVTPTGRVLLVDFGLATTDGGERLTRSGSQLGSLPYLAPEQVRGEISAIGPRTDVYGLGVTLYEILTFHLPYAGSTAEETMRAILEGRPRRVRAGNAATSRDAETVCMTAMERDAPRRYASAGDLARDLGNVLALRPIEARPAGPAVRVARFVQRHPAVAAAAAIAALAAVGGLAFRAHQESEKRAALEIAFRRSEGLRLAALSGSHLGRDPGLALGLAIEAAEREPGLVANNALAAALGACREIRTLDGHAGDVRAVRFSPDGRLLATGGADGAVLLWDGETGEPRGALHGHEWPVVSLAFSRDGRRLLSAGDWRPRIWQLDDPSRFLELRGHAGNVVRAAFEPGDRWVASASDDGTARVWSAADGSLLRELRGHTKALRDLEISPDARWIATASLDGTARLFDAETGECRHVLAHADGVLTARFDASGSRLVTACRDRKAHVWSVATGERLLELAGHTDWVVSAAFDPSGARVITTSSDWSLAVYDASSGERVLGKLAHHRAGIGAIWSPDGASFATFARDRAMRFFDATTGNEEAVFVGHLAPVVDAAFSPDGARIATAGENARLWRTPSPAERPRRDAQGSRIVSARPSPDGRLGVLLGRDGVARLVDFASGATRELTEPASTFDEACAWSGDSKWLATSGSEGTVHLFDVARGARAGAIATRTSDVVALALGADGGLVAAGGADGRARVWRRGESEPFAVMAPHRTGLCAAELSRDGTRLATASRDGQVRVWNLASSAEVASFAGSRSRPLDLAFRPDGRRVALSSYDREVRVWDLDQRRFVTTIRFEEDDVFAVQFSPDGTLLATGGAEGAARVWNAETGEEIVRDAGGSSIVRGVVFPTADSVAAMAMNGTARRFPVDLLRAARARRPRELTLRERIEHDAVDDPRAWKDADAAVQRARAGALWAPEVIARLRADASLSDDARGRALRIAEGLRDSPRRLSNDAWAVLAIPGRDRATYERAVPVAEEPARIAPGLPDYERCRGLAYVRVGRFDDAIRCLDRPDSADASDGAFDHAFTLAILERAFRGAGRDADVARTHAAFEAMRPRLGAGDPAAIAGVLDGRAASAPSK